jgi:RimJ/RimL family protein N-acetyltransferase
LVFRVESGFVFLLRVIPALRAEVHVWFPDHKLSARTGLLKDLILWGFLEFDLQRLETFVASTTRPVKRFLRERLGFKYEGTMRRRRWNAGRLIDIEIYSLLREEVL